MSSVPATPPLPDYHTHTALCGHARGRPEEYVEQALARGLTAIGIADHLPLLHDRDPQLSMDLAQLEGYVEEVLRLKQRYPGFVFLGIEADYRPDTIEAVRSLLGEYPFDYVVGSVHFIDGWGFDDPRHARGFAERPIDHVYRRYFELVGEAADTGVFTIIGHLDLVKKFGHRPTVSMDELLRALATRIARGGLLVELNTAGLRKPVAEIYPAADILPILRAAGVRLTFGSDAHAPEEVGCDFTSAVRHARSGGFTDYAGLAPSPGGVRARIEVRPLPGEDPA